MAKTLKSFLTLDSYFSTFGNNNYFNQTIIKGTNINELKASLISSILRNDFNEFKELITQNFIYPELIRTYYSSDHDFLPYNHHQRYHYTTPYGLGRLTKNEFYYVRPVSEALVLEHPVVLAELIQQILRKNLSQINEFWDLFVDALGDTDIKQNDFLAWGDTIRNNIGSSGIPVVLDAF